MSVVIPAYNSCLSLQKVLDTLLGYQDNRVEVIVVNDGSTDDTLEMLKTYDGKIKVLTNSPNRGRSFSRNRGAEAAQGDILIFLDADCVPERSDFFDRHFDFHQIHEGCLIGHVHLEKNATPYQAYRFSKNDSRELIPMRGCQFATGNASVKKSIFLQTGGFDTSLALMEDMDLGIIIEEMGKSIFFDPQIQIAHIDDDVTLDRDIFRNFVAYKSYFPQLLKKHKGSREAFTIFAIFEQKSKFLMSSKMYFLAAYFFVHLTEKFISTHLRHKLYSDLIISAAYCGFKGLNTRMFKVMQYFRGF